MSFVRLDSGEFPPLGATTTTTTTAKLNGCSNKNGHSPKTKVASNQSDTSSNTPTDDNKSDSYSEVYEQRRIISNGLDFVRCRIGLQLHDYTLDLKSVIEKEHIGLYGDFIITPIEPPEPHEFSLLPDLVLPQETWWYKVAVELQYPSHRTANSPSPAEHFKVIFQHALYLGARVIIISCPDSDLAYTELASIINSKLEETAHTYSFPLILFKVHINSKDSINKSTWMSESNPESSSPNNQPSQDQNDLDSEDKVSDCHENFSETLSSSNQSTDNLIPLEVTPVQSAWRKWNSFRSHLIPDWRIGVCLSINDDLSDEKSNELLKWNGEPVRMIIIHVNQFTRSPGHNSVRLATCCHDFIKDLTVANSFKTSLVIEGIPDHDVLEYLTFLRVVYSLIKENNVDRLRGWNDKIQPPLQPLSTNLDAATYQVFESDITKYIKYENAMKLALKELVSRKQDSGKKRKYILMVLGAGRGPLVEAFTRAIKELNLKFQFKIYALDKNKSSVLSLKYKQMTKWRDIDSNVEIEVVESDMRSWKPGVKADIIASELLGSLGDNELSPECLDGAWKLSTPETICIPQEYYSWIAPICSYTMHQEIHKYKEIEKEAFDQIYVSKLTNFYMIDFIQRLFYFEHKDLSQPPGTRDNTRYTEASFWSGVDTVCHGLAGYFTAKLFGSEFISTVPFKRTPNMESWFPIFIPFEEPIQMPRDTKLEVHFWRKESKSKVWYEWALTSPERSRTYGHKTKMSKFI